MVTFPVKYFHSAMRGAPVVSGTAGTMISLLDACLITGFGTVTLTGLNVSGGVASATVSAGSSFEAGAVVLLAGATPDALNGEARVLSATSTGFTFATTAADGAASGTVTAKYAPVGGWEKTFSGTNKAVYRSTAAGASGFLLRVDDSGGGSAAYARVVGYESMSDLDTGSGAFPTSAQISDGGYWHKSNSASSTAAGYVLAADSRFMIVSNLANLPSSAANTLAYTRGFGDLLALAPGGDAYSTALSCCLTTNLAYGGIRGTFDWHEALSGAGQIFCPRARSGLGSAVSMESAPFVGASTGSVYSGDDGTLGAFPSSIDGQLKLSARYTRTGASDKTPRAVIPGVYTVPQSGVRSGGLNPGDVVTGSGALAGRKLMAVGAGSANNPEGVTLIDTTGPWR